MLWWFRDLFSPRLISLNTISLDKQKLLDNLSYLESIQSELTLFPVLKSNAYGHGLKEICCILRETSVSLICVDSYPEYQFVKKWAKKRALIIGETAPENYRYYKPRHASVVVYTIRTLEYIVKAWWKQHIHLFLNTWMNREWIQLQELWYAINLLKKTKKIYLEWVMSHFSHADYPEKVHNNKQIETFKRMYRFIEQAWFSPKWKHISNSAWLSKIDDSFFTAARVWLSLYGYSPLCEEDEKYSTYLPLQPVLEATSTIVSLQQLETWDIVSYWWYFTATQAMTIATIPFGFHEWLSRWVSNDRCVLRKWKELPVIWTICMNLCCIDTLGHDVELGDNVTVISRKPTALNSLLMLAKKQQTISYEVLVNIDEKIRRVSV